MAADEVFWHGSPSGDLRGGATGLHLGTCLAATQALEARIGRPVEGAWDGTREYGETLLWGKKRFWTHREGPTGYNADAPDEDHYPTGKACFSDHTCVSKSSRPMISAYHISGCMTNHPWKPHSDDKANAIMRGQLKKGTAKCGYYYTNEGEDTGSISAVVPNARHLQRVDGKCPS